MITQPKETIKNPSESSGKITKPDKKYKITPK